MDRWVGKTAVVTGASAGIGAAICVSLANAGLRVVGLARRPHLVDNLQQSVVGNGNITSRQCDVANSKEVAATFEWIEKNFGTVHILINNAGILHEGHITEVGDVQISENDLLALIDVNLKGPIICSRHAVASMKRAGFDGHIVNINSIAGHYLPFASTFNLYPTSKHALTVFTKTLNYELADFNNKIKTTSISPGLVHTNMVSETHIENKIPILKPTDVANAVMYVISTPPDVNINELTITPVAEKRL